MFQFYIHPPNAPLPPPSQKKKKKQVCGFGRVCECVWVRGGGGIGMEYCLEMGKCIL